MQAATDKNQSTHFRGWRKGSYFETYCDPLGEHTSLSQEQEPYSQFFNWSLPDLREASALASHVNITYVTEAEMLICLQSSLKTSDIQYLPYEMVLEGKKSWRWRCVRCSQVLNA